MNPAGGSRFEFLVCSVLANQVPDRHDRREGRRDSPESARGRPQPTSVRAERHPHDPPRRPLRAPRAGLGLAATLRQSVGAERTMCLRPGSRPTARVRPLCAEKVTYSAPVCRPRARACCRGKPPGRIRNPPLASRLPSGLKARAHTAPRCPRVAYSSLAADAVDTRNVPRLRSGLRHVAAHGVPAAVESTQAFNLGLRVTKLRSAEGPGVQIEIPHYVSLASPGQSNSVGTQATAAPSTLLSEAPGFCPSRRPADWGFFLGAEDQLRALRVIVRPDAPKSCCWICPAPRDPGRAENS